MSKDTMDHGSAGRSAASSGLETAAAPNGDADHEAGHRAGRSGDGGHGIQAGHGEHGQHAGHDPEVFRRRFWLILLVSIPVVVTSEMIMDWFGYELSGV